MKPILFLFLWSLLFIPTMSYAQTTKLPRERITPTVNRAPKDDTKVGKDSSRHDNHGRNGRKTK